MNSFTPFRIEDTQLAAHSSLITAREAGVLNEKRCNSSLATEFIPPSEEIQRLFSFEPTQSTDVYSSKQASGATDEYSFTEEEFAKMPSTLMKAVRRTDALLVQTEAARKAAIETNNELKGIHSLLVRYAKKTLKDMEKIETAIETNVEKSKPKGFRRQCKISDTLCGFMGLPPGSTSSRVEVNHTINEYIRAHKLINKEHAQCILPDEKLASILSEDAKGNKITYFSIQKYIKHHYLGSADKAK
jgi:chromatin remodeling complex protein RSC6